ncbi:beta-glucosidase [Viscerimonas tarda]
MKFIIALIFATLSLLPLTGFGQTNQSNGGWIDFNKNGKKDTFENPSASEASRINDLLSQLTIEEKISLLRATSPGIPRLNIPKYYHGNEALHGVVRPGRFTVFPQAIGMASMWNPDLHYQIATAISDEARARWNELDYGAGQIDRFSDILTFWSPTVNMARDPRWGRTPETYGEDPYLTGVLGTQFVKGLQGDDPRYLKVVATPKHFAANNEEHNRFVCNPQISERQLREYYFPAFEACAKDGKAASFMSAYNAINDVPCTANPWLLTKVLRNDWGFRGYVVSDCGGPSLLVSAMKYVKTKEAAATLSIKAGLDLECGDDVYMQPLLNAYNNYMVSQADIDTAAYRVLRARIRLGLFDAPTSNPYSKLTTAVIGSEKHKQLALDAARQSIVLLKNKNNVLPLNPKKVKSIAVVGINAGSSEFGDYSGAPVNAPVSILQGIKNRVGNDTKIVYAPWKSAVDGKEQISKEYFPEGLKTEYYPNTDLKGEPKVRTEEWIEFEPANQAPDPFIPGFPLSIRWTGKLRPNITGNYTLYFTADDGSRLSIDGKMLIDQWKVRSITTDSVSVYLEAGKDYNLKAEYFINRDNSIARLYWKIPEVGKKERIDLYGEAGKVVRNCEKVIAVMGINKTIEREGKDRSDIHLPADQMEFLQEIYKLNPNMIVVLVAGSSLAIDWLNDNIPAIVNAWYPGEQGGTAVAEVLFGDYNPAGRLPLTYYRSLDDVPAFDDYDITKGRTYQYFRGKPLYPFGYGLSYTSFSYTNLKLADSRDVVSLTFDVKNTGRQAGDEVSQVYVKLPEQSIPMPIKELKGFKRTFIGKGETQKVKIELKKENLRYWDDNKKAFVTPLGTYLFMIGSSSEDIRLKGELTL